jgi:MFS transporter, MHS family, proline/betaine transporter
MARISEPSAAPGCGSSDMTRIVVACCIGSALEWFDFAAYAMFATSIAKQFFPTGREFTSLLLTFGTFATGFLVRPVGALVLGLYADRSGRKAALTATMFLMSAGTAVIATTPGFATLGILAPLLIVLGRLIQGFSAGGEYGSAISFLIEHAPPEKRSQFAAWQMFGVAVSYILAGLVGYGVTHSLTPSQVDDWGWRVPFVLGAGVALAGLYIRKNLEETPVFRATVTCERSLPHSALFRGQSRGLVIGIGIVAIATACSYTAYYMPTYATQYLGLKHEYAFVCLLVLGSVMMFSPLVGRWAEAGRGRHLMLAAAIAIFALATPLYYWLARSPTGAVLIIGQGILATLLTLYSGAAPGLLATLFPPAFRSTGVSLTYSISVTVFGGFAPMILTALIGLTHNNLVVGYYLMVTALISIAALSSLKPYRPLVVNEVRASAS